MSNYTLEQEAVLNSATSPITFANAEALGQELGKSTGSVIAKIKSLELAYECKPKPAKRPRGLTKAELVAEIAESLGVTAVTLNGLEKATAGALANLVTVTAS